MSPQLPGGCGTPPGRWQLLRLGQVEPGAAAAVPAGGQELGLYGQHAGSLAACLGLGHLEERPVFLQLGSGKSSAGN